MKIALILLSTLVAISHQQFQRPRVVPWLSPYSSLANGYHPLYYDDVEHEIPYFRYSRPRRPTAYPLQTEHFNRDVISTAENHDMIDDAFPDTQSRLNGFGGFHNNNAGRFLYASTINNPFLKTATFTISSTVTTVGAIVLCVPSNNLAAVPSPTCAGRKKRETDDSEHFQFPIVPSETLKLIPTILPSLHASGANERSKRSPAEKHTKRFGLMSSKDEGVLPVGTSVDIEQNGHLKVKRFLGSGLAVSTTVTRYSFVGATLTSTVILDPTGANVAVCLPVGYIVCA